MQVHTSNLPLRIGATLTGIGYGVVGAYAITASTDAPSPELADRAFWLGTTFVIAAVLAIAISWLVSDLSNIWCIPPRRTPPPRRLTLDDKDRAGQQTRADAPRPKRNQLAILLRALSAPFRTDRR